MASDTEFLDRMAKQYDPLLLKREPQLARLFDLARRGAEHADTITALRAEVEKLRGLVRQAQSDATGDAHEMADLRAENEKLRAALTKAKTGLDAMIRHYAAHNHVTGEVIPGDEQYPWVRHALIGRDAAAAALAEEKKG